jgi:hypothetical protein
MDGTVAPDLTWCNPSGHEIYVAMGIAALAGITASFVIYVGLRSIFPRAVNDVGCLGFTVLVSLQAVCLAYLGLVVADALVPDLDICGTTDRHVMPFMVGLVLLPSALAGAVFGSVWRSK